MNNSVFEGVLVGVAAVLIVTRRVLMPMVRRHLQAGRERKEAEKDNHDDRR